MNKTNIQQFIHFIIPCLNISDVIKMIFINKKFQEVVLTSTVHSKLSFPKEVNGPSYDYNCSELKLNLLLFPHLKHIHCSYLLLSHIPGIIESKVQFRLSDVVFLKDENNELFYKIKDRIVSIDNSQWNCQFAQLTSLTKIECTLTENCDFVQLKKLNPKLNNIIINYPYRKIATVELKAHKFPSNTIFKFIEADKMKDNYVSLLHSKGMKIAIKGGNSIKTDCVIRLNDICIPNTTSGNDIWDIVNKSYSTKLTIGNESNDQVHYNLYDLSKLTCLKSIEMYSITCNKLQLPTTITQLKLFWCTFNNKEVIHLPLCEIIAYHQLTMFSKFKIKENGIVVVEEGDWYVENTDLKEANCNLINTIVESNIVEKNDNECDNSGFFDDSEDKIVPSSRTNSQSDTLVEPKITITHYKKTRTPIYIPQQVPNQFTENVIDSMTKCLHLTSIKIASFTHLNYSLFSELKQLHLVNYKIDQDVTLPNSTTKLILDKCNYFGFNGGNIQELIINNCNRSSKIVYPTTLTSLTISKSSMSESVMNCQLKEMVLLNVNQSHSEHYLPSTLTLLHCNSCTLLRYAYLEEVPLNKLILHDIESLEGISIPTTLEYFYLMGCESLDSIIIPPQSSLKVFYSKICLLLETIELPTTCKDLSWFDLNTTSIKEVMKLHNLILY